MAKNDEGSKGFGGASFASLYLVFLGVGYVLLYIADIVLGHTPVQDSESYMLQQCKIGLLVLVLELNVSFSFSVDVTFQTQGMWLSSIFACTVEETWV